ncbi:hypothetical protein AYI68_g6099 [Smittium mucronatum]|uniref:Uncharacterized protein n=1 Tax=Smittium mucronatum TaxID=133383 RepID=A0A1R0GSF7_9FUNG|nr:hypothetical protein AYI68_g6099 [Smittium mucronatum]
MGMFRCNREFVKSGYYPYGFSQKISIEALELSEGLNTSIKFVGEPVTKDLVSSLLGLSLSFDPTSSVRFSQIITTVWAVQTLSFVSTGSKRRSVDSLSKGAITALRSLLGERVKSTSNSTPRVASSLAIKQHSRSEGFYQNNWYREFASKNTNK